MKKAFISGISGFAGSYLAEYLLKKDYIVYGTYYQKDSLGNLKDIAKNINLYQCDIRKQKKVKQLMQSIKPDEIYHLAAITFIPFSFKNPKITFDTNLNGTINLYEAVKDVHINPNILFVGSADEYGIVKKKNLPIKENCPLNTVNPYAINKASADLISNYYYQQEQLKIVRVRAFNHIGPRQSAQFVVSSFAKQIAQLERKASLEKTIKVGNLLVYRDFTDVRDIVAAYWLALQYGNAGEVYNISSGQSIAIEDILDKLLEMSNEKIEIIVDSNRYRKNDSAYLIGDARKIKNKIS